MRWNSLTRWILSAGCVIALYLTAAAPVYAAGCAPGATCLPTQATGAPLPAQFVAQCSGAFPDFVTSPAMVAAVPATGPLFKLSQNYPSKAPADDAPWLNIDFTAGLRGANDYLYALRDYSFDGMIDADFKPELNNVRPWFHMPMMNFGPNAREPMHGLTTERTLTGPELGLKAGVSVHNFAVGFYNAVGGVTIGRVWKTSSPDVGKAQFFQGAMAFKILFSAAQPAIFKEPISWPARRLGRSPRRRGCRPFV